MRPATAALPISDMQKAMLSAVAKSSTEPHRKVLKAKALLMAADGWANIRIAARLEVSATSVKSWRERFAAEGMGKFGVVQAERYDYLLRCPRCLDGYGDRRMLASSSS